MHDELRSGRCRIWLVAMIVAGALWPPPGAAQDGKGLDKPLSESTYNPLNLLSPGHFRVQDPKNLTAAEAEAIYQILRDDMRDRYALSELASAADYLDWTRYTTAPYKSVTHGRAYLNNYANDVAKAYGRYERAGVLPEGSVLAKDSFMVKKNGDVLPGPMALMEKMASGFNPDSGDWRYTQILPDGSILGTTNGENAEYVAFCMPCHQKAGAGRDHLFFPKMSVRAGVE